MAIKLTSSFKMSAQVDGHDVSFSVRIPPSDVVIKLQSLLDTRSAVQKILLPKILASEKAKELLSKGNADIGALMADPEMHAVAMAAMGDQIGAFMDGLSADKEHASSLLIEPYCGNPVGIELDNGSAPDWPSMRKINEPIVDQLLSAAAVEIVERTVGQKGRDAIKNLSSSSPA